MYVCEPNVFETLWSILALLWTSRVINLQCFFPIFLSSHIFVRIHTEHANRFIKNELKTSLNRFLCQLCRVRESGGASVYFKLPSVLLSFLKNVKTSVANCQEASKRFNDTVAYWWNSQTGKKALQNIIYHNLS